MTKPAEDAARESAARFRLSLGRQLDAMLTTLDQPALVRSAPDLAVSRPGAGDGRGWPGDRDGARRSVASREAGPVRPAGGSEADAPAYHGEPTNGRNVDSWMRFAQAAREQGGLGLSREQASGVVGNLIHESGHNIAPIGVTGDHGTAHGAAQWRHERYAGLIRKSREWGLDPGSTEAQQRYMRWELDNTERGADRALRAARTPEEAAHVFNRHYERSADPGAGRRATARRLFDHHRDPDPPPAPFDRVP